MWRNQQIRCREEKEVQVLWEYYGILIDIGQEKMWSMVYIYIYIYFSLGERKFCLKLNDIGSETS